LDPTFKQRRKHFVKLTKEVNETQDLTRKMDQLLETLVFAADKHSSQRRKDAASTPYIGHPIGVAHLIATVGGVQHLPTLQAAILHDVVEDTKTPLDEIKTRFGQEVADIVGEVSDDRSLLPAERKKQQITHAAHASTPAKLVKLADKLHNLSDLLTNVPRSWSRTKVQGYFVRAPSCLIICYPFLSISNLI
jgi:(p)ppGpp synthase/HD superfamily hydrolase